MLTEDKDFGDLAFFFGSRSSGIVLLRPHGVGAEAKAGLVAGVLEAHEGELTKVPLHFIVVRPGRPPRSRPLGDLGTGGRPRVSPAARVVGALALVGEAHLFGLVVARGFGKHELLAR